MLRASPPPLDVSKPAPLWLIVVLAAVTATGPFAMQIFLPALPAIAGTFDVTPGIAQMTLSLSMVAIAVSTLIYGPLSDRYGRRPVLIVALLVFVAGSIGCVLAPTIETLIAARIVQAIGGAAGMVVTRAVARDLFGPERAVRLIAQLTLVMVLAPMLAPGIGGLVSDLFNWRGIFVVVTVAGSAIFVAACWLVAESHAERSELETPIDMVRGFGLLFASRRFCALAVYPAFSAMIFFSFISGAPYIMVDLLDRPATEYGLYFILIAGGFMAGNYITVQLGERVGMERMMRVGMWLALAGVLIFAAFVAAGALSPQTMFLSVMLAQIGQGIGMPNAQAAAINVVPHRAGTASAVTSFLQWVVAAAASQTVGVLLDDSVWPMIVLMLIGVVGALTAALIAPTMTEHDRRRTAALAEQ